jgi:sRNA-binding protein
MISGKREGAGRPAPRKRKPAKLKLTRKPGGGRKPSYGEPTVSFSSRLPQSVIEVAKFVGDGNTTAGLIEIVKQSVQYRLEHGSGRHVRSSQE